MELIARTAAAAAVTGVQAGGGGGNGGGAGRILGTAFSDVKKSENRFGGLEELELRLQGRIGLDQPRDADDLGVDRGFGGGGRRKKGPGNGPGPCRADRLASAKC